MHHGTLNQFHDLGLFFVLLLSVDLNVFLLNSFSVFIKLDIDVLDLSIVQTFITGLSQHFDSVGL